jgi:hypothetical protein
MPKKYAIRITEDTLDLIEFLTDGVRPMLKKESTVLIVWVQAPNEITTAIEVEADLYKNGFPKDMIWLTD